MLPTSADAPRDPGSVNASGRGRWYAAASSLSVLLPFAVAAQAPSLPSSGGPPHGGMSSAASASAARAVATPVIDGVPGDPAWGSAPVIDQFLEYAPNEGAEPRFETEARVLYDDRNLYVQVRMFDPAPDSIVSQLARRDTRAYSDHIKLVIDSYHDRRTGYEFALNPAGVKRDFYVHGDIHEDPSWDAVWDGEASIDSLGWTAEFRIPLSQLRFGNKPEHTWGLMIVRDVARTGQRISWPLYRRNTQGYISQAGTLSGIRDLPTPRRLEVVPYVVARNASVPDVTGFEHATSITGGADIKYGVSSNLTLDATINPDFGQVEADPAELNLTAFESFFEERRPFFLEGTGIFDFKVNCAFLDYGCTGLFYSRRIGRAPQLGGVYFDDANPISTTILGATKLTGRLGSGLSVGVLDAVTQEERNADGQTIEPQANYAVVRLQQDFNAGHSGLGAMFTGVNRALDEHSEDYLRRSAYAGGLDFRHRFLDRNYELAATVSASRVSGTKESIALLQQCGGFGCTHNYERPDGDVRFDPTRTSLTGNAQRVALGKLAGQTRFQTVYQRYSPGYDINDLGFLSRDDQQSLRNWIGVTFQQPTSLYRYAELNVAQFTEWTAGGLPTSFGVSQDAHMQFHNQMWAHLGFDYNPEWVTTYDDRAARGGPAVRRSGTADVWLGVEGDRRKRVTPMMGLGMGTGDDGRSRNWYLSPSVDVRASSRMGLSLGAFYQSSLNDDQFHGNVEDGTGTHHTFARLDQSTFGLTTRFNLTASPTLSLQVHAQPFISTGRYADWRELADPRASEYSDRYRSFDGGDAGGFNVKQFRSNAVLRWEYRPGSALFLVWSQGRDAFEPHASTFRFGRDARDLFRQRPDNTILVKASYWFNP